MSMLLDSDYKDIWKEKEKQSGFDWGEIDLECEYLNMEYRPNTFDADAYAMGFKLVDDYLNLLLEVIMHKKEKEDEAKKEEEQKRREGA